ncbi:hypothetical protein BH772_gp039 [Gordonia phage Bachita]|uniref:Uncharacterized protein n=1 Tax=Gordonia phage Bachita TaxID=1838061 RepID=A0A160DFP3_9CAUD|nr:hypothetical protein BH772_gp039 [Gordonia phage Bachita]ANA86846.1 hypothetical protein PBI_BACHITA_172 [Gordonia phage Bachita]
MNAVIEIRPSFLGFDPWSKLDMRITSRYVTEFTQFEELVGYIEEDTFEVPLFCKLASRLDF